VFDTNVVIRHFLSCQRRRHSPSRRVFELWLVKSQLQLVVNPAIIEEFLTIMRELLGIPEELLKKWKHRFSSHHADEVAVRQRLALSRDPKDNVFLEVAAAGKVDFLITNDLDLLEINEADKRQLKFHILTPEQFLASLANQSGSQ
jgi:putative PIN family toxin of toxin-antitoxin system